MLFTLAETLFPIQMDDVGVLQHRCLLDLERRIRDFGQDGPAEERCLRLRKDGDTLRSAGWIVDKCR